MVEVVVEEDCGNAPKKAAIRDWLVALASGKPRDVMSQLADDVEWTIAGEGTITGSTEITTLVDGLAGRPITTLVIDNILSHGKRVSADGSLKLDDGTVIRFAHFYTFRGHGRTAPIARITTFSLEERRR